MALVESTEILQPVDGPMGVAVKRPDTNETALPTIVLFHHGPGLDEATHDAMRLLASQGFFVVCSDRYHRLGLFTSFAIHRPDGSFDSDVMPLSRAALLNTSDDMVARDLAEVLRFVDENPYARSDKLAIVGYCVGVRSMLFAMSEHAERFVAGVGFHPSFCVDAVPTPDGPPLEGILTAPTPLARVPEISGRVLLFFGTADQISSPETNRPLIDAIANLDGRGEIGFVENADHGFALPGRGWAPGGSDRSYDRAFNFLRAALAD